MGEEQARKILIITQTPPADSGRGTRMRIGIAVEALAQLGEVSLLIVSQRTLAITEGVPEKYRELCKGRVLVLKDSDARSVSRLKALFQTQPKLIASWNHDWLDAPDLKNMTGRYDLVWVFRLRMWPIFNRLIHSELIGSQAQVLDMDDVESKACLREALLLNWSLGRLGFVQELLEYVKLRVSEARAAKAFNTVLVCSNLDKLELDVRIGKGKAGVLPNGIRIPSATTHDAGSAGREPLRAERVILFVGSLDFYPNVEGLLWMIQEVLPLLTKSSERAFRFIVVGRDPDPRLTQLSAEGLFELHADVPDVAPYYGEASLVVAPIHAGSGTRIKILEAFAFGVPVVSTTLGAEGLETQDRVHLAIADTPASFAREILTLLDDPVESQKLVRNATRLLNDNFALSAICARIKSFVDAMVPLSVVSKGKQ